MLASLPASAHLGYVEVPLLGDIRMVAPCSAIENVMSVPGEAYYSGQRYHSQITVCNMINETCTNYLSAASMEEVRDAILDEC